MSSDLIDAIYAKVSALPTSSPPPDYVVNYSDTFGWNAKYVNANNVTFNAAGDLTYGPHSFREINAGGYLIVPSGAGTGITYRVDSVVSGRGQSLQLNYGNGLTSISVIGYLPGGSDFRGYRPFPAGDNGLPGIGRTKWEMECVFATGTSDSGWGVFFGLGNNASGGSYRLLEPNTEAYAGIGFINGSAAKNGGRWSLFTRASATDVVETDLGITPASNTLYNLKVVCTKTSVTVTVNGVSATTSLAAALPWNGSTRQPLLGPTFNWSANSGATTPGRLVYVEQMWDRYR